MKVGYRITEMHSTYFYTSNRYLTCEVETYCGV